MGFDVTAGRAEWNWIWKSISKHDGLSLDVLKKSEDGLNF